MAFWWLCWPAHKSLTSTSAARLSLTAYLPPLPAFVCPLQAALSAGRATKQLAGRVCGMFE